MSPARGPVAVQVLLLGTLFVTLAVATDSCGVLAAGTAARWLRERVRWGGSERYVTGSVYIGLGLATAFPGRRAD